MSGKKQAMMAALEAAQKAGDKAKTEAAFKAVLARFPDDALLHGRHAEFLLTVDAKVAARDAALRAIACVGENHHLHMALCGLLFRIGAKRFAYKSLPPMVDAETADETIVRLNILREQKDEAGVGRACQKLAETRSLPAERWRQLAMLASAANQPGAAVRAFGKALEGGTPTAVDYAQLISLHIDNDDIDGVRSVLDQMSPEMLAAPEAQGSIAMAWRKLGDNAAARRAYERLLEFSPLQTAGWHGLAELADKSELPAIASRCRAALEQGTENQKANPIAYFALGRMAERAGDRDGAFADYALANELMLKMLGPTGRTYVPSQAEKMRARSSDWFGAMPTAAFARAPKAEGKLTPIFIVGMPRSGTSLFERMMASLPGVRAGGEMRMLTHIAAVAAQDAASGRGPVPADITPEQWAEMAQRYRAQVPFESAYVTDKLPQNYRNVGWALKMFPDAPVIYLKRDARDIGWSMYKRPFQHGFNYAFDQQDLAHAIKECRDYMAAWKAMAPDRILEVEFEALVRDPETEMRRITTFFGLPWDDACLNPEKLDQPSFTISEQQVRQPINTKGIGRWEAYEAHLGPMLAKLKEYGLA